ncbi:MAG: hypothetical protein ACREJV_15120 [Candidatus Rokuibacteriota bacterium]
MADTSEQLFDLWKKQFEEGAQAWARVLGQAPSPSAPSPAPGDPATFWRPLVDQWVQAWARMFAQTPMSPDASAQFKQFLDQSIEAWSRALGQAMNSDAFAQLLGRYLDQWLAVYAPARKAMDQSQDAALQTLNLASRTQLTAVARQLVELDERVERMEDTLKEMTKKLDALGLMLVRREAPVVPRERG